MMQISQEEKEKNKRKRGRFFPWLHKLSKELTFDIFSRLPVESLLQCKRVLKSWHTLISDPQFVNAHLLRASSQVQQFPDILIFVSLKKLFRVSQVGSRYESVKSLPLPRSFTFDVAVTSCNGLLAFPNYDYKSKSLFVHIWNPFTRKRTTCPFATDIIPQQISSLNLAHGFGYDPILNEYKVVALFRKPLAESEFEAVVCTIGSTSWRYIIKVPFKPFSFMQFNSVHLNGTVYWVASADQSKKGIGCFGIKDEKFGFIACLPQAVSYTCWDNVNLSALGGDLCLVDYASHENVVVWVLKKHCGDEVWTKQFVLKMPERIASLQLLYVFNNGEILLRMMGWKQKKYIYYDPKENRYRDNETLTDLMLSSNYSRTFAHVGSLVSPPLLG